uniref:Uncharacterized protein n=2 Tax=Rhinopithecus TaxID=542827 RepID=A0A2K6MQV1_RHIBE
MHIRLSLQVNSKAACKVPPFLHKWPNVCMLTAGSIPRASFVILWKERKTLEAFTRNSKYISFHLYNEKKDEKARLLLQLTLSALPFGFM